ncbi:Tryptophan synthase beta chain [Stutzerimonas stutzeri]
MADCRWSPRVSRSRLARSLRNARQDSQNARTLRQEVLTSRVYDVAVETPLQPARQLSERIGNQILLKREDLQPVFSFKVRGAYNKLAQLSPEELARGVVTASAGNHAQGVALAAKQLGIKATIVMPRTTPELKVQGVRARGGKVVLHGDAFPEALAYSLKLVEEKGLVYIHPYDDPDVIAGQGTVAMEIVRQRRRDRRDLCAGGRRRAGGRHCRC